MVFDEVEWRLRIREEMNQRGVKIGGLWLEDDTEINRQLSEALDKNFWARLCLVAYEGNDGLDTDSFVPVGIYLTASNMRRNAEVEALSAQRRRLQDDQSGFGRFEVEIRPRSDLESLVGKIGEICIE